MHIYTTKTLHEREGDLFCAKSHDLRDDDTPAFVVHYRALLLDVAVWSQNGVLIVARKRLQNKVTSPSFRRKWMKSWIIEPPKAKDTKQTKTNTNKHRALAPHKTS